MSTTTLPPETALEKPRQGWWAQATAWERFQVIVLSVLLLGHIGLQLLYVYWYIEDAAISFAFAKHLAGGEGLVAWPGGERVEGYSNPSWVFLMAAWEVLGVDGFASSKIMGGLFGAATVWITWDTARLIRPRDDVVPLLAALLLAINPQFVIWAASGLENSLFCFFLALGVWLVLRELRDGGWPWSALAFFGLAITRPEGILYAFFGGLCAMVFTLQEKRGLGPTLRWLVTFFVPFGLYHFVRYEYFAWEWPNTYYSKMGRKTYEPASFDSRGWKYVRDWAEQLWQGFLAPVYVFAMTGLSRARGWLGLLLVLLLLWAVVVPGPEPLKDLSWWPELPVPADWAHRRVWLLAAVAVLAPAVAIGRVGWQGLLLNWLVMLCGVYFAIHASGDWMRGFRWLSMIAGPQSILYALGVAAIADGVASLGLVRRTPRKVAWFFSRAWSRRWTIPAGVLSTVLLGVTIAPDVMYHVFYTGKPETSPAKIQRRVNYMHYVQHRLHLDHVVNLDVDMGGTMWWSGHEIVDIAGLVDVPMGHHDYQQEFIREYIFNERRPDFAHLHAGWETKMGVKSMREYKQVYFEIPGYPTGRTALHLGNRVRTDLFIADSWEAPPSRSIEFGEDIRLEGVDIPLGEAPVGRHLYVEIAWSTLPRDEDPGFRVIAFVRQGEHVKAWDLPPGYDWYTVDLWQKGQIVYSRYSLNLPADLPPGPYDFGLVVFGREGNVVEPLVLPEGVLGGADDPDPAYARGEVRWSGILDLVSRADDEAHLREERANLEANAVALDCETAEEGWEHLRWRRSWDFRWQERNRPAIARTLGTCWLGRAGTLTERDQVVDALARARWWDHWTPGLEAAADPIADQLVAEGREALADEQWETAYRRFTDALRIDASRSWARRWAEEARDKRLGIDADSVREREEARARARREREERMERLRREREAREREGEEEE